MSEYKHQFHVYKIFTTAENQTAAADGTVYADCQVPFKVKTVKTNWAYSINADGLVNFLVQCSTFEGDTVGTLCKFQYDDGAGAIWSSDGFRQDNTFVHTYESPRTIQNSLPFKFNELIGSNINAMSVVLHLEFLG